jgi:hypothetical protein
LILNIIGDNNMDFLKRIFRIPEEKEIIESQAAHIENNLKEIEAFVRAYNPETNDLFQKQIRQLKEIKIARELAMEGNIEKATVIMERIMYEEGLVGL